MTAHKWLQWLKYKTPFSLLCLEPGGTARRMDSRAALTDGVEPFSWRVRDKGKYQPSIPISTPIHTRVASSGMTTNKRRLPAESPRPRGKSNNIGPSSGARRKLRFVSIIGLIETAASPRSGCTL
ncbi:hypothetical protein EYF80_047165 [Liparis tanakae]|uniref:Uncharacterized protein n=1 Tax=Liparis tanakae TaxID=230148 RepID=A0A4Z2FNC7_9TELE|nr:hypothetical protein EYF80_047165 [Liparis tanakae]